MGLLGRLFGSRRNRTTAKQLAYFLAGQATKNAFDGPQSLDTAIRQSGTVPSDEGSYRLELIVFAAFPMDVLLVSEQTEKATVLQEQLRAGLLEILRSMIRPEYHSRIDWGGWRAKIDARFEEYATILQTHPGSTGALEFGLRAAEHITGSRDPAVAMQLGIQFSMILKHLSEPIRSFNVVDE